VAVAGSSGCGGESVEVEADVTEEEERTTIPLSADFPYAFATGVDTDALLIFRDLHEVTLTASQAELRQHFYDPEPFTHLGRKSLQEALEDADGGRVSIKSGLLGTDLGFQFEVGENLLDHLNLHAALLPEPEFYSLEDLSEDCVDDEMGGNVCSAPVCAEEDAEYSIVTGASGCTVHRNISLSDFSFELFSTEPTITGGRKQIRWSLFDPALLSPADAASFFKNQTRHLIPVLDEEFVETNFRDPVRTAAAFALWEDQLSDSERAELESLSDEASADAAEAEFLALSLDARFRRILPPYLRKHLGNWRSGNFPDCIATAMNSTIPR